MYQSDNDISPSSPYGIDQNRGMQDFEGDSEADSLEENGMSPVDEELITTLSQKYIGSSGVMSTFKTKAERQRRVEINQLKTYLEGCQANYNQQKQSLQEARDRLSRLRMESNACRSELERTVMEHDALAANDMAFSKGEKLRRLRAVCDQLRARYEDVEAQSSQAQTDIYECERAFAEAEFTVFKNSEMQDRLAEFEEEESREKTLVAQLRARKDAEVAERHSRMREKAEREREALEREQQDRIRKAIEDAKEGRRKALDRLSSAREHAAVENQALEEFMVQEKIRKEQEMRAIKEDMQAVQSKLRSKLEKLERKRQKESEDREKERIEILAAGGNPYEVFRLREEKSRIEKNVQEFAKKQQERESHVMAKIVYEEELFQRKQLEKKRQRETIEEYIRETGKQAQQDKLNEYMTTRIAGGNVLLDPSGRKGDILPSTVMTVRSNKFGLGLGTVRPEILEREKSKFPDTAPDPMFVPKIPPNLEALLSDKNNPPQQAPKSAEAKKKKKTLNGKLSGEGGADSDEEEVVDFDFSGMWGKQQQKRVGSAPGKLYTKGSGLERDSLDLNSEEDGEDGGEYPRRLKVGKLSKLELQYLEKAKERHKESLTKKQVVCGKEFTGPAFIPKPAKILFKDFDVGDTYRQTIVVTNVSYSFNTFKVLPLTEDIRDFFEISHVPPGHMSAGITADIHITFLPKVNKDIHSELLLLSETGPIAIPLECLTKKLLVKIEPSPSLGAFDLGLVPIAEHTTREFYLVNEGALSSDFHIKAEHIQLDTPSQDHPMCQVLQTTRNTLASNTTLQPSSIELFSSLKMVTKHSGESRLLIVEPLVGTIPPYGKAPVKLTYFPQTEGVFEERLIITLVNDHRQGVPANPRSFIDVKATGSQVPLCVEREILDLKCCYHDTTYRDTLVLVNRGGIAMKVQVDVPSELKGHLEFHPSLGYVQANSTFNIQVKFRPLDNILEQCAKYANKDTNTIEVPIRVRAPDQTMPVYFMIRAQTTTPYLQLQPTEIDFGKCSIFETAGEQLLVHNPSLIPQTFGFVKLPKEFEISPSDGFSTILPGETLAFQVLFSPLVAVDYDVDLQCRTSLDKVQKIRCLGTGVQPVLKCNPSVVALPPTSINDTISQTIILSNISNAPQCFEASLPEHSCLQLTPHSGVLEPGQSKVLLLEFFPTESLFVMDGFSEQNPGVHERIWDHKIPIFIKDCAPVFMEVKAHATLPTLLCEVDQEITSLVTFGDVALRRTKTIPITLRNTSQLPTELINEALDPFGPFSLPSALGKIAAGESRTFLINFTPNLAAPYSQLLVFKSTHTNNLRITMQGRGVDPVLEIEPNKKIVFVGDSCVGDGVTRTIKLVNKSTFDLPFTVSLKRSYPFNSNGTDPFTVVPSRGVIPQGGDATLTLMYSCDRECDNAYTHMKIQVENRKHRLFLTARSWPFSVFAAMPVTVANCPASQLAQADVIAENESGERLIRGVDDVFALTAKPQQRKLILDFGVVRVGESVSRIVEVGSAVLTKAAPGAKAPNGEFVLDALDVEAAKSGFAVDLSKGPVEPGSLKPVTFKFSPAAEVLTRLPVAGVDVSVETAVNCTLKGGAQPPGSEGLKIKLILRAKVSGKRL